MAKKNKIKTKDVSLDVKKEYPKYVRKPVKVVIEPDGSKTLYLQPGAWHPKQKSKPNMGVGDKRKLKKGEWSKGNNQRRNQGR